MTHKRNKNTLGYFSLTCIIILVISSINFSGLNANNNTAQAQFSTPIHGEDLNDDINDEGNNEAFILYEEDSTIDTQLSDLENRLNSSDLSSSEAYRISYDFFTLAKYAESIEDYINKERILNHARNILENLESQRTDLSDLFSFEHASDFEQDGHYYTTRTNLRWRGSTVNRNKIQEDLKVLELLQQVYILQGQYNSAEHNRVNDIADSNSLTKALVNSEYARTFSIDFQLINSYFNLMKGVVETIRRGGDPNIEDAARLSNAAKIFDTFSPIPIQNIRKVAKNENATLVFYSLISNDSTELPKQLYIWVVQPSGKISFVNQSSETQMSDLTFSGRHNCTNTSNELSDDCRSVLITGVDEGMRGIRNSLGVEDLTNHNDRQAADLIVINQQDEVQDELNSLYHLLIGPIEDLLPNNPQSKVIFIPDGSLNFISFAALKNPNNQKYLVEEHTILRVPNIRTLLLSLREDASNQHSQGNRKALIVGNPTPMPDSLEPLPGAEAEVLAINRLLNDNGFDTKKIIGKKAKKKRVVKNMDEGAEIIHLATHGIINTGNHQLSSQRSTISPTEATGSIALAKDYLSASEIFNITLSNTDLVVLSACNTGVGELVPGGVIGLPFSFTAAGASSVLMSLWNVPDASTAKLMRNFYDYWLSGRDKAQALRLAMMDMIQEYPNSPKDWAAFTLVGSAN
ncbi:CHAT domain-containing protein [Leptolyngbyaceae cyanobacterium CCMR0082]|uniref:CHAT domain-containing protein n=1 Tax=Adonisia turfae CCMR0082 TaxID=2304604 RepID=A0A6M0SDT1_9CYAN|nr:CHAT domain-containing protein [Adonisia turfae]NEZ66121.1 CHAT domain-containing protein [Adonisia turfae CCMR0082]